MSYAPEYKGADYSENGKENHGFGYEISAQGKAKEHYREDEYERKPYPHRYVYQDVVAECCKKVFAETVVNLGKRCVHTTCYVFSCIQYSPFESVHLDSASHFDIIKHTMANRLVATYAFVHFATEEHELTYGDRKERGWTLMGGFHG